ncbi:MAG: NAD(P)-dependent alcohol dehydrogenase [Candidatus Bipolaricaulota bacterium]|nr:MAG: NAD(P)-dependent alcohol dehydrogenase [Candidatus Bipolaricaulota bacterium]
MRAVFQTGYGSPDAFEIREVPTPVAKNDQVLIRVRAAALHAGDVFMMRGVPYFTRLVVGFPKPRGYVPGYDVAGVVEAVGKNVNRFAPEDEVFGSLAHTCAEFVCTSERELEEKPANLSLEQAAAVPTSAIAALHGIRDAAKVKAGMHVLINGASGGVGTFAVQIAKAYGAEVTGVCSTRNVDLVRSIGADHVIDYTQEDFTRGGTRYDVILDQVANHPLRACRRALTPTGVHIPNSGHKGMPYIIKATLVSIFVRRQGGTYHAAPKPGDLSELKGLIESGKVSPVIDRTHKLEEISEAFRHLDAGHARGKVVIAIEDRSS